MAKSRLALGDHVTILDLDITISEQYQDPRLLLIQADVRNEEEVTKAIEKAVTCFGALDIVIHGACVCAYACMESMTSKQVSAIWQTNYLGAWILVKAASHYMSKDGRIWLFSSGVGITGLAGVSAYASSKGAIEALAKCLRLEYPFQIGIIHPPLTRTQAASCFPIPDAFKKEASEVGQKLARRLEKKGFLLTMDWKQTVMMQICYLFPLQMGKWLTSLTNRALSD